MKLSDLYFTCAKWLGEQKSKLKLPHLAKNYKIQHILMTTNNCEISQKTYHLMYKMGALKPSEKKHIFLKWTSSKKHIKIQIIHNECSLKPIFHPRQPAAAQPLTSDQLWQIGGSMWEYQWTSEFPGIEGTVHTRYTPKWMPALKDRRCR